MSRIFISKYQDLDIWYLAIIGEVDNSFLSRLEPRKLTCVEMSVFFSGFYCGALELFPPAQRWRDKPSVLTGGAQYLGQILSHDQTRFHLNLSPAASPPCLPPPPPPPRASVTGGEISKRSEKKAGLHSCRAPTIAQEMEHLDCLAIMLPRQS